MIDLFINIDSNTPLNIRFMLCVISLEALLISKDDRDYLGWKLSEKVSFLLGTSEFWMRTYHKIGFDHIFPYHVQIPNTVIKKVSDNRRSLNYKMRKLYNKRSGFAHGGKSNKEQITGEDYTLAYTIVRLTIFQMLNLLRVYTYF